MMTWILLALFGLCAAAHLIFCLLPDARRWQDFTKVLLMPALLLIVIWADGPALVKAALFLGWLGDIFLLHPDKKPFFLAGLVSFLAGHACYIPAMFPMRRFSLPVLLLLAAGLILVGIILFLTIRRSLPGDMMLPAMAYLAIILAMAWAAFSTGQPMLVLGAVSFVASDYTLARQLFVRKYRYGDFFVMLTYLLAQFLLAAGLCGIF